MRIIRNSILPFKGYKAMNFFGICLARKDAYLTEVDIIHESIHTEQMKETLYIFFYLWYGIEWLIKLIKYCDTYKAYRNIGFEKEAYIHQYDPTYLYDRVRYTWYKWI